MSDPPTDLDVKSAYKSKACQGCLEGGWMKGGGLNWVIVSLFREKFERSSIWTRPGINLKGERGGGI